MKLLFCVFILNILFLELSYAEAKGDNKNNKFLEVKFPKKNPIRFPKPPAPPSPLDLEKLCQNFVLETKKIEIPNYSNCMNPSMVKWKDNYLMSFRLYDPLNHIISRIGLVWLDNDFSAIGEPQILQTREKNPKLLPKSEDARLVTVDDRLYIIYNDNEEDNYADGGIRRMYFSELYFDGKNFELVDVQRLSKFDEENKKVSEKNWIPFDYNGTLLFSYSLLPHCVLWPLEGTGRCVTLEKTTAVIDWNWGLLRGGTPAILIGDEYFAFFHSCHRLATKQSDGKEIYHYYMGAYTFSSHPPFSITRVSPEPIVARSFYRGKGFCNGQTLEKRVIFPGGFVFDEDYFWVIYGKDDEEMWVAKFDKKGLYESLVSVWSKKEYNK